MRKLMSHATEEVAEPYSLSDHIYDSIESRELKTGITANAAELAKVQDISVALDDMHIVIDRTKTPTPVDAALVMVISNTATMGTEMSADKFIPGIESYKEKVFSKLGLESIADRVCLILKYFLQNVLNQSDKQTGFFRKQNEVVLSYKRLIKTLSDKFPIPDNRSSDVPRTVTFTLKDPRVLETILGTTATQGDLISQTKLSTRHLTMFSKLLVKVRGASEVAIRASIPSEKIKEPVDAANFLKGANKKLCDELVSIWEEVFLPSELIKTGYEGGAAVSTLPLPGLSKFMVAFSKVQSTNVLTAEQFMNRSSMIRSYSFSQEQVPANTHEKKITLQGVTNEGIRDLVFTVEKFLMDVMKYYQTLSITCETTSAIALQNKGLLDSCFDALKPSTLDASVEAEYKQYIQTYVGDIESLYKTNNDMTMVLGEYLMFYVNSLLALVESIPGFTPEGTYNESKTHALM